MYFTLIAPMMMGGLLDRWSNFIVPDDVDFKGGELKEDLLEAIEWKLNIACYVALFITAFIDLCANYQQKLLYKNDPRLSQVGNSLVDSYIDEG